MENTTEPGSFEDISSLMFEAPVEPEAEAAAAPVQEQTEAAEEAVAEAAEVEAEPEAVEATAEPEQEADEVGVQDAQITENNDETHEEPLYSVKVDGEMRDVPLDELLRGYSGQEYVQKGMKEAASLKDEAQNAYQVLQDELRAVQGLRSRMENGDVIARPEAPKPEMYQNDPISYMEAKMEYDGKLDAYEADMQRLTKLNRVEQVRMDKAHQARLAQEHDILVKRIPDLADPEKAPALKKRMIAAGQNYYGFTEQEMMGQTDARVLSVFHDAMVYRNQKAALAQVKPAKSKPVIKPGTARTEATSKTKQRQSAKTRMQRNGGDMDSVVNFLLS